MRTIVYALLLLAALALALVFSYLRWQQLTERDRFIARHEGGLSSGEPDGGGTHVEGRAITVVGRLAVGAGSVAAEGRFFGDVLETEASRRTTYYESSQAPTRKNLCHVTSHKNKTRAS